MAPQLRLASRLEPGASLRLDAPRAHYLTHVLRLRAGAPLRVFNAEDGEWRAVLAAVGKRDATLELAEQVRPPSPEPGPVLHFAPIRRSRLDWLVEKAVELGVGGLVPLLTERTVVKLENPERLRAIVVEAAEQCERLSVPELAAPRPFGAWLAAREPGRVLLFADEAGGGRPLAEALAETAARPTCWSAPRADSRRKSARCCWPRRGFGRSRSGRASCVPRRRRSPCWRRGSASQRQTHATSVGRGLGSELSVILATLCHERAPPPTLIFRAREGPPARSRRSREG